ADDAAVAAQQSALWWKKDEAADRLIEQRFGALVAQASQGTLDHWSGSANGMLVLIVLLDQFRRNIFRNTPDAFSADPQALALTRQLLAEGLDQSLRPIERVFAYLPLEHSENLQDQQQCVGLMRNLQQTVPAHQRDTFAEYVDFAIRHSQVIERFGRFPHRNVILNRPSSAEEIEFLKQPGSSF
ncbi:MAG: DUF924 family protein, partial [Pseudomonadota bacterium]